MIDSDQLRREVIRPALLQIGFHSEAAEELVFGTACVESACGRYLRQIGGGPARGIFQMEPRTHDDIWANYLNHREFIASRVRALVAAAPNRWQQLATNLAYAAAMCRVHYLRVPEPLPRAGNTDAMAAYWKAHYNTEAGRGTVRDYVHAWRKYAGDL